MDGTGGFMLSVISQLEKDKHYMVSFIWGILKIVKGNKGERRKISGKYQKGRQNMNCLLYTSDAADDVSWV